MIDLVAELDALLATWRARRASYTAHLIDELSSWFAIALPDIGGKTRNARHASWLHIAARPTPLAVARLLATVAGTHDQMADQLEQVATWPADPRTTWFAKRLYETQPFATSSGNQKIWRRLFDVIEHHADPRVLPIIGVANMNKVFRDTERGLQMRARAQAVSAKIAPLDATLAADEKAALEATHARITAALESGRALRDAVRLEVDDTSKTVYLDWLMERGYEP